MALTIVVVCTLLPLVGVALVIAWGGRPIRAPLASASAADLPVSSPDLGVGPGWLSVVLFSVPAVLHGAVATAVAGAFSGRLPLPSGQNWKYYLPLLGAVLFVPAGFVLVVGALVVMVWATLVPAVRARRLGIDNGQSSVGRPGTAARAVAVNWAARGLPGLAAVAALPLFISAVTSIVSR